MQIVVEKRMGNFDTFSSFGLTFYPIINSIIFQKGSIGIVIMGILIIRE